MCQALGFRVVALHRIRIMHLTLAGLPSGAWKPLTPGKKRHYSTLSKVMLERNRALEILRGMMLVAGMPKR